MLDTPFYLAMWFFFFLVAGSTVTPWSHWSMHRPFPYPFARGLFPFLLFPPLCQHLQFDCSLCCIWGRYFFKTTLSSLHPPPCTYTPSAIPGFIWFRENVNSHFKQKDQSGWGGTSLVPLWITCWGGDVCCAAVGMHRATGGYITDQWYQGGHFTKPPWSLKLPVFLVLAVTEEKLREFKPSVFVFLIYVASRVLGYVAVLEAFGFWNACSCTQPLRDALSRSGCVCDQRAGVKEWRVWHIARLALAVLRASSHSSTSTDLWKGGQRGKQPLSSWLLPKYNEPLCERRVKQNLSGSTDGQVRLTCFLKI